MLPGPLTSDIDRIRETVERRHLLERRVQREADDIEQQDGLDLDLRDRVTLDNSVDGFSRKLLPLERSRKLYVVRFDFADVRDRPQLRPRHSARTNQDFLVIRQKARKKELRHKQDVNTVAGGAPANDGVPAEPPQARQLAIDVLQVLVAPAGFVHRSNSHRCAAACGRHTTPRPAPNREAFPSYQPRGSAC